MIWSFNNSPFFYVITSQCKFSNSKTQLCQGRTQWCCVFLQIKLQQITVQEHIFGDFALAPINFSLCASPTDTFSFTYHPICEVNDFQRLIFGNSQSYGKFTGKPKIVSHPTSSQESLKQQIKVYIYIAHHLRGQWHIHISPQTAKSPFLDSYSCPNTIRPYCLTTNLPLNTVQRHLSLSLQNPSFE